MKQIGCIVIRQLVFHTGHYALEHQYLPPPRLWNNLFFIVLPFVKRVKNGALPLAVSKCLKMKGYSSEASLDYFNE